MSEQPAASIRDVSTLRRTLRLGATGTVASVTVDVDIAHTYTGDLVIELLHGTQRATLFRGNGAGTDLKRTFTSTTFAGAQAAGDWTLSIADTAAQDVGTLRSWKLRVTLGTGSAPPPAPATPQTVESAPNAPIRDLGTITNAINVTSGANVNGVSVSVRISHTYIGDLRLTLEHGGRRVVLHDRAGGSTDDINQTWNTTTFQGLAATGAWTLRVEDTAAADVGTLVRWSVTLQ